MNHAARNTPKTGNAPRIGRTSNLSCKEVVELVSDYLEGTLLPEKNQQVEEHLSGCDGCTNYVQHVRMTIGMLRDQAETPDFPNQKEELLSLFRATKKEEPLKSYNACSPCSLGCKENKHYMILMVLRQDIPAAAGNLLPHNITLPA